jgi:prepilin-type N-terminal cleavage/methylation domain-containing protein
MTSSTKGFTLIELIVVIAIIAILAAVSIVGYQQFIQTARDSRALTELRVIRRQVDAHYYTNTPLTPTGTVTEDLIVGDTWLGEVIGASTNKSAPKFSGTVSFNPVSDAFSLTDLEVLSNTANEGAPAVWTYVPLAIEEAIIVAILSALSDEPFGAISVNLVSGLEYLVTYEVSEGIAEWVVSITP